MTNSVLMSNDLSDWCRVCLQMPEESQYLDLTTIYDEEDHLTYSDCFMICTQIDLKAGLGVPHHLCKPCGLELQMSYDFHKKVEESKRVILQYEKQMQGVNNEQKLLNKPLLPLKERKKGQQKDDDEQHLNDATQFLQSPIVPQHSQTILKVTQDEHEYLTNSDEENGVELLSKIGSIKDSDDDAQENEHLVPMEETIEIEEHVEMDDFQNLETLEEEESIPTIKPVVIKNEYHKTDPDNRPNSTNQNIAEIQIENEVARYHVTIINDIKTEEVEIKKEIIEEHQLMEVTDEENPAQSEHKIKSRLSPRVKQRVGLPYKCDLCAYSGMNKKSLLKHQNLTHGRKEPLKEIEEMPMVSKKIPIKCNICGHNLLKKNSLYQHRLRKHPESTAKAKKNLYKKDQTIKETPLENQQIVTDNIEIEAFEEIEEIEEIEIENEVISVPAIQVNSTLEKNHIEIDEIKIENEIISVPDIQVNSILAKTPPVVCKICGKSFLNKNSLSQHRLRKHRQQITEMVKQHRSKTENGLYHHHWENHYIGKSSDSKKFPFICNLCGHGLRTKNALDQHRIRKHSKNKTKETIKESSNSKIDLPEKSQENFENTNNSSNKDNVNKTESISSDIYASASISITKPSVRLSAPKGPPFLCNMCNYKSANKAALYQHRYRTHRKHNAKSFKTRQFRCELCYHSFLTKNSLTQHQNRNHGQKPLSTPTAAKPPVAAIASIVTAPVASTTPSVSKSKVRPYLCDYCGYRLPTLMALIQHRHRKHRNNKLAFPFKCQLCVKAFRSMAYLRLHIETKHENKKLFICKQPKCGKYFEALELLNQHILGHKDTLYSCEFCDEMFPTLRSFQAHAHEIHNVPVANAELNSIMVEEKMPNGKTETDALETIPVEEDDDDEFN